MRTDEQLAITGVTLQRKNPEDWKAFLKTLDQYFADLQNELIAAPTADLPVAQGKAKSISSLILMLKNAAATADKLERK